MLQAAVDRDRAGRAAAATLLLSLLLSFTHLGYPADRADPEKLPAAVSGRIQSPAPGSPVARTFPVAGGVEGTHRSLWLAVRVGELYWPKSPELKPAGTRWSGVVREGGAPPEGRFDVVLLDVSQGVAERFRAWQAVGDTNGHYPGIPRAQLGDFRQLDAREYRLAGH